MVAGECRMLGCPGRIKPKLTGPVPTDVDFGNCAARGFGRTDFSAALIGFSRFGQLRPFRCLSMHSRSTNTEWFPVRLPVSVRLVSAEHTNHKELVIRLGTIQSIVRPQFRRQNRTLEGRAFKSELHPCPHLHCMLHRPR